MADIDRHIQNGAGRASHQFALRHGLGLEMQARIVPTRADSDWFS
jgi:hypothetical protein